MAASSTLRGRRMRRSVCRVSSMLISEDARSVSALRLAGAAWLLRQDDVRGVLRRGVLRAFVAEAHRVDAGEEVLAAAEDHGRNRKVHLVDQPRGEVLPNGRGAAAEPDVLALGRLPRALQGRLDAIGDEMEDRAA